jgi:hypothetical protein
MERHHAFAAIGLAGAALLLLGCGTAPSPVQPTPPVVAVPVVTQQFRLEGGVSDTAWRALGDVRVQVLNGPRAGTVATTDEHGHFSMPGTFSGPITLEASKDGYRSRTNNWPSPGRVPPADVEYVGMWFYLQPLGPSANVAGEYTLTLTAADSCTNLPNEARTRTYTATITAVSETSFAVRLSGARFYSSYSRATVVVAGDFAGILAASSDRGQNESGPGIVEQLGESTFVSIEGGGGTSFGPTGMTVAFDGYFEYCPVEPAIIGDLPRCPSSSRIQCDSHDHRLTLVRR